MNGYKSGSSSGDFTSDVFHAPATAFFLIQPCSYSFFDPFTGESISENTFVIHRLCLSFSQHKVNWSNGKNRAHMPCFFHISQQMLYQISVSGATFLQSSFFSIKHTGSRIMQISSA